MCTRVYLNLNQVSIAQTGLDVSHRLCDMCSSWAFVVWDGISVTLNFEIENSEAS